MNALALDIAVILLAALGGGLLATARRRPRRDRPTVVVDLDRDPFPYDREAYE